MATFKTPELTQFDSEYKDLEKRRVKLDNERKSLWKRMNDMHADGTVDQERKSYSVVQFWAQGQLAKPGLEGGLVTQVSGTPGESHKVSQRIHEIDEELASGSELMKAHAAAKMRARSAANVAIQESYNAVAADAAVALAKMYEPLAALEAARQACMDAGVNPPFGPPKEARLALEDAVIFCAELVRDGRVEAKALPAAMRALVERTNPNAYRGPMIARSA